MDCYNQTYRTARKIHYCEFCGKQIEKGEKYLYEYFEGDGNFFGLTTCVVCLNMIKECVKEDKHYEFDNNHLGYWLYDKYCYNCDNECDCSYLDTERNKCPHIRKHFDSLDGDENGRV